MAARERPLGIVLISIYFGLFGVVGALGGACALIAGGSMDTLMEVARQAGEQQGHAADMPEMPRFGGFFVIASILGVVAAILEIAAAYGLWSFQRWGRPLGLGLACFFIAWTLFWFFVLGAQLGGTVGVVWMLIVLAINALIVWYLRKPEITRLYAQPAV